MSRAVAKCTRRAARDLAGRRTVLLDRRVKQDTRVPVRGRPSGARLPGNMPPSTRNDLAALCASEHHDPWYTHGALVWLPGTAIHSIHGAPD